MSTARLGSPGAAFEEAVTSGAIYIQLIEAACPSGPSLSHVLVSMLIVPGNGHENLRRLHIVTCSGCKRRYKVDHYTEHNGAELPPTTSSRTRGPVLPQKRIYYSGMPYALGASAESWFAPDLVEEMTEKVSCG